jgi:hypothetical protein
LDNRENVGGLSGQGRFLPKVYGRNRKRRGARSSRLESLIVRTLLIKK